MLIRFDGRTAIVAGAARGIGQTIALSLANDGARVIACDLLVDDLAALAGRADDTRHRRPAVTNHSGGPT
jgi:NAD(P)-dependent dehydrogenase (short-subunit alcohol dehydrogenase family)